MMRSTLYKTNTLSLIYYSASSLKQQSMDIHVTPLGHIILIQSQPVFALSTNYIIFDLTRSMLEHTIYSTRGEHSYRCSNTRSPALEESTLIDARTHDLQHSRRALLSMLEHTIYSTRGEHSYRCSNTRSTALEESTLTITSPIRFKNLKLTISLHFDLINFLENS
jgi:23S rRNA maturation-related 3'-5' exoribonuclease YhaM